MDRKDEVKTTASSGESDSTVYKDSVTKIENTGQDQVIHSVLKATLDPYDILVESQRSAITTKVTVTYDPDKRFQIRAGKPKTFMEIKTLPRLLNEPYSQREYTILDYDFEVTTIMDLIEKIYGEMQRRIEDIFTYVLKPVTENVASNDGKGLETIINFDQFNIPNEFVDEFYQYRDEVRQLRYLLTAYSYPDRIRGFCRVFCSPKFNGLLTIADGFVVRNSEFMSALYEDIRRVKYWRDARTYTTQIADQFVFTPYEDPRFLVDIFRFLPRANDFIYMTYGTYLNLSVSSTSIQPRMMTSGANFSSMRSNPLNNFVTSTSPNNYGSDLKKILWSIFMMGYIKLEIEDDLTSWHPEAKALVALMARNLFFFNGDQENNTGNLSFNSVRKLDHLLADVVQQKMAGQRTDNSENTYNDPLGQMTFAGQPFLQLLSWAQNGYLDPSAPWHSWDFMGLNLADYVDCFRMMDIPHIEEDIRLMPADWLPWRRIMERTNASLLRNVFNINSSQLLSMMNDSIFGFFRQLNILSYRKGWTPLLPPRELQNILSTGTSTGINVVSINLSTIAFMLKQENWSITLNPTDDIALASHMVEDYICTSNAIETIWNYINTNNWNWMNERDTFEWIISKTKFKTSLFQHYYEYSKRIGVLDHNLFNFHLNIAPTNEMVQAYHDTFIEDLRYFNIYPSFQVHLRLVDMREQIKAAGLTVVRLDAEEGTPTRVTYLQMLARLQAGELSVDTTTNGVLFEFPAKIMYHINDHVEASEWHPIRLKPPVVQKDVISQVPIPKIVNLRLANVTRLNVTPDDYYGAAIRSFMTPDFVSAIPADFANERIFIRDNTKVLDILADRYISVKDGIVL